MRESTKNCVFLPQVWRDSVEMIGIKTCANCGAKTSIFDVVSSRMIRELKIEIEKISEQLKKEKGLERAVTKEHNWGWKRVLDLHAFIIKSKLNEGLGRL